MTFFEKFKAWFKKLFGSAASWDKAALGALTIVSPLVVGILTIADPAIAAAAAPILAKVQTDLATAATIIDAGKATPTLTGALNDVQTNIASILQLAEVKNSANAAKVTADVNTIVAEVKAILAEIPGGASA